MSKKAHPKEKYQAKEKKKDKKDEKKE